MADDTPDPSADPSADPMKDITAAAAALGDLVARHPAVAKAQAAQKSLGDDPEVVRLLGQFEQRVAVMERNMQMGQPVGAAERSQVEQLQTQLAANLKYKNFQIAQVDLMDLLRKVSQAWQRPLAAATGAGGDDGMDGGEPAPQAAPSGGPKLVI